MIIWGIDLGVRSFHAAGISVDGSIELYSHVCAQPKKVKDQAPGERGRELASLSTSLQALVMSGDLVYIEEPPLAGGKNIRTMLKLAQVSGVLASGAHLGGAKSIFVPVDTWKKGIVGAGGVSKDRVSEWLAERYESYSRQCGGDQNRVDATCIALYGLFHHRTSAPGGLDYTQPSMAAS